MTEKVNILIFSAGSENGIDIYESLKYNLENQYFDDLMKINDNEMFVNCGGIDRKTTEQFINIYPNYKAIYYFKPVKQYIEESMRNLSIHERIKYFNEGTYKDNTELRFSMMALKAAYLIKENL